MEQLARRQLLQLFFAAGAAAAVGVSATKALADAPAEAVASDATAEAVAQNAEAGLVSEMETTQAVVIRPGRRRYWRRRGPRIIIRPRRRRRICWRRRPRGPLICTWR